MDLSDYQLEKIQETSGFGLFRARGPGGTPQVLVRTPGSNLSDGSAQLRLEREYSMRGWLDSEWALLPMRLVRHEGQPALLMRDPGGQPCDRLVGKPSPVVPFLKQAISITRAVEALHARGLIHNDICPANFWIDEGGSARVTGFGLAVHDARERPPLVGPGCEAGSLPYMAPEQTGRTNRSVDTRSDLYGLGITLYELLVGALPFNAIDLADWVHCHIARQPPPAGTRMDGVPPVIDAIILRLLAKDPDERYQTASGVRHDLERCLAELSDKGAIEPFGIGARDRPQRLLSPGKLYGRSDELASLVDAFQRVAKHRQFEMVIISGRSGMGKSALVNEFGRTLEASGALFATGKFDQYKRSVPFATLSQAFERLLKQILTGSDQELARWRSVLGAAVGVNGQLMADLFPSLSHVIGPSPPLAMVSPQEAKNRFNLVFRRFVGAFAQPDRPLVLFLDDLQWLDAATQELLEKLAAEEPIPSLMLVGAYRREALLASDPLEVLLSAIARAPATLRQIELTPLGPAAAAELTAAAVNAAPSEIVPLTELVYAKTQGNPFFLLQFLGSIHEDGLLRLDNGSGKLGFDLQRIRAAFITDNVADLIVTKLGRYPASAVDVMKILACFGMAAPVAKLSELMGQSETTVESALLGFVYDGLLLRVDDSYYFAHDSVREAAYALLTADERAEVHLRVGRLLSRGRAAADLGDDVFSIVGQFNRASGLVVAGAEQVLVAELNLEAGKRAIAAAAYETALRYLDAGYALLGPTGWSAHYRLSFELIFHRADCKFIAGDIEAAQESLAFLADVSAEMADEARIVNRQVVVYAYRGEWETAVALAVACAARHGLDLPIKPGEAELAEEYRRFARLMQDRPVESLFDLPDMTDPHWLLIMDVLESLNIGSGVHHENLHTLTILRMANISLEHGLSHESAHIFSNLAGLVLGWRFGDFATGHRFGQLALRLADERGFDRYAARIYAVVSGTVGPWSLPLSDCFELAIRALEMGREQGGVTYAGYAWSTGLTAALGGGRSLGEVHRLAEAGLALMTRMKFSLAVEFVNGILAIVRGLRGMTETFGSFSYADFDEQAYEAFLERSPHLWHALVRYRVRKLQMRYLAGDWQTCLAVSEQLAGDIESIKVFERAEYCLFAALARAAELTDVPPAERQPHLLALAKAQKQLAEWAGLCSENFAARAALVAAEIARLEDRDLAAQRLYEEAIRAAANDGQVSMEALGYELAARFYETRDFRTIAQTYLRKARACYARWGADGKVAQLDRNHPGLGREDTGRAASALTSGALTENLDLSALVDIYHAVSGEIELDRLIEQLMTIVVEQAGAVRGLLLLQREGEMQIAAEATTGSDGVAVELRSSRELAGELPLSMLNYAVRSLEPVILDDALHPNMFSSDVYLLAAKPRSILCLPLVKQGRLVAVLYLENSLSSHVFTPARLGILQMLSSPAAVSIENAGLFLEAKRARDRARQVSDELRQSFDMIPTLAWRAYPDGRFEIANKKWKDYSGSEVAGASAGDFWPGTYHPDDIGRVRDRWQNLLAFGVSGEVEARIRRFDGEFRRFLFRIEPMRDESGAIVKWYGTAVDIEDFRRAEQAQEALARVSRITALGELSVSIAHEVNQPLMAVVTNAATCLRWLAEERLNVVEARRAAERIINDGHRAGDVIASIRALAKKAAPEMVALDLNDAILEVVQLMRNELDRNKITVETRLDHSIGCALADRVQMQQVILNLVLNGIEAMSAAGSRIRKLVIQSSAGPDGELTIAVSDTGKGLDPALQDRVFEAFFTTKAGGIGMGLSICRSIIEGHRGRMTVSPNRPRGATFAFSLPAYVEEQAVANAG